MQKAITRPELLSAPAARWTVCPWCGFDRGSLDCCGDPVPSRAQAEVEFWSNDLPDIPFGGGR